ncbi:thiamine biosynthesis protein ThiH [Candidatus Epulonipiscium fishelsonii]|uniref:Thiamine biosynthesis protein ThiH n=1 Tax=Candidatus Epulonipiscium fishelsonii TaxID=77094 RepID=A0ACC8XE17_9FIRM|nr:thiamine biosynthesis protein ThiH [Epulopiscium sp. SCG-D08WGA-EpuloA1]
MDIERLVLEKTNLYNYEAYTEEDVRCILSKTEFNEQDFGILLSPAAEKHLEKMAQISLSITRRYFGNNVTIFTPLYLANYCENHCIYCGFNCYNKITRAKLNFDEIEKEYQAIAATGLKDILLLTGESRTNSNVEYIAHSVKLASKYFSTIGIEIYSLDEFEYKYLHECSVDFVSVYQETYNKKRYAEVHKHGPKSDFSYRFNSQERALKGGIRGVAFGALLGINDFRKDIYAAALHASYIQKKYPTAEIGFSVPRLRPYLNAPKNVAKDVYETQLLQVMLALKLFLPFANITISTRERAKFRDNVVGLVATRMSAGVSVGVGGHNEEQKGDEQFEISDDRSVKEIHEMLTKKGLQAVYRDYILV